MYSHTKRWKIALQAVLNQGDNYINSEQMQSTTRTRTQSAFALFNITFSKFDTYHNTKTAKLKVNFSLFLLKIKFIV